MEARKSLKVELKKKPRPLVRWMSSIASNGRPPLLRTHPPKYQLQFEFQLYWSVPIYWAQSNHQTSKANCPRTSKDINSGAQWTTLRTASEIRKEMLKFRVSLEWKAHYVNCKWDSTLLWRSLENPFVKKDPMNNIASYSSFGHSLLDLHEQRRRGQQIFISAKGRMLLQKALPTTI